MLACRAPLRSMRTFSFSRTLSTSPSPFPNALERTASPVFRQPTIAELLRNAASESNTCGSSTSPTPAAPSANTTAAGWIRTLRKTKNVTFLELFDGSTNKGLQCILPPAPPSFLQVGACISIQGHLRASPNPVQQPHELHATQPPYLLGACPPQGYPIQKKQHSLDFLRSQMHLRQRTRLFTAVTRLRHTLQRSLRSWFDDRQFVYLDTPLLTAMDCEGAGEVFGVEPKGFFGCEQQRTGLSVSAQLFLEMGVHSFARVYTLSPCFRADPGSQDSTRHLAEFWMLEAEWAFGHGLQERMDVVESVVTEAVREVVETGANDLEYLNWYSKQQQGSEHGFTQRLLDNTRDPFERMTYTQAMDLLTRSTRTWKSAPRGWGHPLQSEHERFLCDYVGRPVFVTDYPAACKAFYMRPNDDDDDGQTVACFDLLWPGLGELAGGSMREERADRLEDRMRRDGLPRDKYEWYLDLRKQGGCPHGGFGLGVDRLVMMVTGMSNIRDVVLAGRWKSRCDF